MSRSLAWVLAAVACGAGLAVQARINGALGRAMDDGIAAALVSFLVGLVAVAVLAVVTPGGRAGSRGLGTALRSGALRPWHLIGGLCGAVVVMAQGVAAAPLGVALYSIGVVAGQSTSGLLVDRLGFAGLPKRALTASRVVGAAVTLAAVGVSVAGGDAHASWLLALPFVAGFLISFQQAVNSRVMRESGSVITQGLVNFAVGTLALVLGTAVSVAVRGWPTMPHGDLWLYAGGLVGLVFVLLAVAVIRHTGVLVFSLATVAGQVWTAVLLDALDGIATPWGVAGAVLAVVGVLLTVDPRRLRRRVISPSA